MTSTQPSTAPSEAKLSSIVASSSRTVAPTLPEMHALLTQWMALADGEQMDNEWTRQLGIALALLPTVSNVNALVAALRKQGV